MQAARGNALQFAETCKEPYRPTARSDQDWIEHDHTVTIALQRMLRRLREQHGTDRACLNSRPWLAWAMHVDRSCATPKSRMQLLMVVRSPIRSARRSGQWISSVAGSRGRQTAAKLVNCRRQLYSETAPTEPVSVR